MQDKSSNKGTISHRAIRRAQQPVQPLPEKKKDEAKTEQPKAPAAADQIEELLELLRKAAEMLADFDEKEIETAVQHLIRARGIGVQIKKALEGGRK